MPWRRILLTAAAFSATLTPQRAVACGNADRLQHDDSVKRIAQIEFHLRYEQHWLADQALPADLMSFVSEALENRAADLKYALDVRWTKQDISSAVQWSRDRPRKQPEHQAWLADAFAISAVTLDVNGAFAITAAIRSSEDSRSTAATGARRERRRRDQRRRPELDVNDAGAIAAANRRTT